MPRKRGSSSTGIPNFQGDSRHRKAGVERMKRPKLMEYINQALDDIPASSDSGNPLEAWTRFIDRLDAKGRASIGDELERQGKNRYTGKERRSNVQRNVKPATALEPENSEP